MQIDNNKLIPTPDNNQPNIQVIDDKRKLYTTPNGKEILLQDNYRDDPGGAVVTYRAPEIKGTYKKDTSEADEIKRIEAERLQREALQTNLVVNTTQYNIGKRLQEMKSKYTEEDLRKMWGNNYDTYMSTDLSKDYKSVKLNPIDIDALHRKERMLKGIRGTGTGAILDAVGVTNGFVKDFAGVDRRANKTTADFYNVLQQMGVPSYINDKGDIIIVDPETKETTNLTRQDFFSMATLEEVAWNIPGIAVSILGSSKVAAAKALTKFSSAFPRIAATLGMADLGYILGQATTQGAIRHVPGLNKLNYLKGSTGEMVEILKEYDAAEQARWLAENASDGLIGSMLINKIVVPVAKPVVSKVASHTKDHYNALKSNPGTYLGASTVVSFMQPLGPIAGLEAGRLASKAKDMFLKSSVTNDLANKAKSGLEGLTKVGNGSFKENVAENATEKLSKVADNVNSKIYEWGKDKPAFVKNITDSFSPNNNKQSTLVRRLDDEMKYLEEMYPQFKDPNYTAEIANIAYRQGFKPESGSEKDMKVLLAFASQPNSSRFWNMVNAESATALSNLGNYFRAYTASVKNQIGQMMHFTDANEVRHSIVSDLANVFSENNKSLREMVKTLDNVGSPITLDYKHFGTTAITHYKTGQLRKGDAVTLPFNTLAYNYSNVVNKVGKGAQPLFLERPMAAYTGKDAAQQTSQSAHAITKSDFTYTPTNKLGSDTTPGALKALLQDMASRQTWSPGQLAEMYVNLKILGSVYKVDTGNKEFTTAFSLVQDGLNRSLGDNNHSDAIIRQLNILTESKAKFEQFARSELYSKLHIENMDPKAFTDSLVKAAQRLDLDGLSEVQQLAKFLRTENTKAIRESIDSVILQGVLEKTVVPGMEESIINLAKASQLMKNMNFSTFEATVVKQHIHEAARLFTEDVFEVVEPKLRKKILDSGISSDYIKRAKVSIVSKTFKNIPKLLSGTEQGKEERLVSMAVRALTNNFSAEARNAFERHMYTEMNKGNNNFLFDTYQTLADDMTYHYNKIRGLMHDMAANPDNYAKEGQLDSQKLIDDAFEQLGIELPAKQDNLVQQMPQVNVERITTSAVTSIDEIIKDLAKNNPDFVITDNFIRSEAFADLVVDLVADSVKVQNEMKNAVDLRDTVITTYERYIKHLKDTGQINKNATLKWQHQTIDNAIAKMTQKADAELYNLIGGKY